MGCVQGKVSIEIFWNVGKYQKRKEKMKKDKLGINYECLWILDLIIDMKKREWCVEEVKKQSKTAELDYNIIY